MSVRNRRREARNTISDGLKLLLLLLPLQRSAQSGLESESTFCQEFLGLGEKDRESDREAENTTSERLNRPSLSELSATQKQHGSTPTPNNAMSACQTWDFKPEDAEAQRVSLPAATTTTTTAVSNALFYKLVRLSL